MLASVDNLDLNVCSFFFGLPLWYCPSVLRSEIRENARASTHCRRRKMQPTEKRSVRCFVVCTWNLIRSELQPLNDRAGGQRENASPVYISLQKLGHVCEWLESNSHCCCLCCLHPCSTADRKDWKTDFVLDLENEKQEKPEPEAEITITRCTFLSLLFLSRRGWMSFFFIASLRFSL